ncbi:MAG: hypothetical protein ABIR79_03445 [Candidatus Binatia bacterium]
MRKMKKTLQIVVLATVFAAGYLSGSVTQRDADAQLKEMGEGALKGAAKTQAGADDSAVKLGRTIDNMQDQVDGLTKNLRVLKDIQSALAR